MTRKTATAEKSPTLFSEAPQEAPKGKPPAKAEPKKKAAGTAVSTKVQSPARVQQLKNTAANTLAVIAEALKDPKFNPDAMEKVFNLQERMVAEQARVDFINAFHEMKKHLPRIDKNNKIVIPSKEKAGGGRTAAQSTPFADYESIREKVDPILDRHGFSMWDESEPSADGGRLNVIVHLDHNSGHGRKTIFPLPAETSGSKNNVQGWGSSFSYGRRYGAIGLLGLRTAAPGDRDRDGHDPAPKKQDMIEASAEPPQEAPGEPTISEKQCDDLVDQLEVSKVTSKKFCETRGIAKLADLPAAQYDQAMKDLKDYAKAKGYVRG